MVPTAEVRCYFVFWDFKDQPDFGAIEYSVNGLLSQGAARVYFTIARTDDDSNCVVITDTRLSKKDATRAREDWEDSGPPDRPDETEQPFVWHKV